VRVRAEHGNTPEAQTLTLSKVINCRILQFLHQMFNMSALLLDDALKPVTPLIAPLLSGVAGSSASFSSKEDTLNI